MYCNHCGKQIEDDSKFCEYCGAINDQPSKEIINEEIPVMKEKVKKEESSDWSNWYHILAMLVCFAAGFAFFYCGGFMGAILFLISGVLFCPIIMNRLDPLPKAGLMILTLCLISVGFILNVSLLKPGARAKAKETATEATTEETTEAETVDEGTTQAMIEDPTTVIDPAVATEAEVSQKSIVFPNDLVTQYPTYEYGGHGYAILDMEYLGLVTFDDCERYCEKLGGHMAVINDQAENDALYQYIQNNGFDTAHFGYTDQAQEGIWKWVDSSNTTYTNWCTIPGKEQPNNTEHGSGKTENYAEFYKSTKDGTWNDTIFGDRSMIFLFEYGDAPVFYEH